MKLGQFSDTSESLKEAQKFDADNLRMQQNGLCVRCAAQAAWGFQLGFSRVELPCWPCSQLSGLPMAWRGLETSLRPEASTVRAWAVEQGLLTQGGRGKIPKEVWAAYANA